MAKEIEKEDIVDSKEDELDENQFDDIPDGQEEEFYVDEFQKELDELDDDNELDFQLLDEDDEDDEDESDFEEQETEFSVVTNKKASEMTDEEVRDYIIDLCEGFKSGEREFTFDAAKMLNEYIDRFKVEVDEYGIYSDELVDELYNAVLDSGDCESIYNLADVEDCNMDEISEAIEVTGNAEWIYKLAKDKVDASVSYLSEAIAKSGNFNYIVRFAQDVEYADLGALSMGVASTFDASQIYEFAANVADAQNQRLLSVAIAKKGNPHFIIEAAKNFDNLDQKTKEALTRGIANCRSAKVALEFLQACPDAKLDILSRGIIKSEDFKSGKPEEVEAVCKFVGEYAPRNLDDYQAIFNSFDNDDYHTKFNAALKQAGAVVEQRFTQTVLDNQKDLEASR